MAEEASGWTVVRQQNGPHHAGRPPFDESSAPATHVRRHPAGAYRIDQNSCASQLGSEDPRESVERRFGDAVGGSAATHVGDGTGPARDVYDPAPAVPSHQRNEQLAGSPRSEQISLKGLVDDFKVRVQSPLPRVVKDRGIVDEDIEASEAPVHLFRAPSDARRVAHVELEEVDV